MSEHTDRMEEAIRTAENSRGGHLLAVASRYFPGMASSGKMKVCPGCGEKDKFSVFKTKAGHWTWGCFKPSCNLSMENIKADRHGDAIGMIQRMEPASRDEAVDKYLERCGVPNPRKDLPEKKPRKKAATVKVKPVEEIGPISPMGPIDEPAIPKVTAEPEPPEEDEGVTQREDDELAPAKVVAATQDHAIGFSLEPEEVIIEQPPEMTVWEDLYSRLALDNSDREKLKRTRGFTRESIEAAGYRSSIRENRALLSPLLDKYPHGLLLSEGIVTRDRETSKLKINSQLCGYGLKKRGGNGEDDEWDWTNPVLIPYRDKEGRCIGIRPHKGGLSSKTYMREHGYELGFRSSRTRVKLYTSFLFWQRPEEWKDTCVLTEGEHKANALAQCGIPACAVPGIQMPRNEKFFEQMVDILRSAGIKRVIIAFDNEDKSHKSDPHTRHEADVYALFACHMLRGDGFYPSHCTLPDEWRIDGKADWDSALNRYKDRAPAQFTAALKKAKPYFPQEELFSKNERDRIIHCRLNRLKFEPQILVGGDEEEELAKLILKMPYETWINPEKGDPYKVNFRRIFGAKEIAKELRDCRGCYYTNIKPNKDMLHSQPRKGIIGLYEYKTMIKKAIEDTMPDDLDEIAGLESCLAAVNLLIKGRVETLSDFTITCDYRVRTQTNEIHRLFTFRNKHGEKDENIQVPPSACSTSVKFREFALAVGNYNSNMGDKHVQALMQDLGTFSAWREIRELSMLGEDLDTGLWIMGDCAFAPDASMYDKPLPGQGAAALFADHQDIIWHDGLGHRINPENINKFQHKTPPKFFQAVGKEPHEVFAEIMANPKLECVEVAKIFFQLCADFIHTFGDSSGLLDIGAMLTYAMAPELLKKYHGHPGLWLDGRFQAGKTEQCKFNMQMWGYDPAYRTFMISGGTTAVALDRAFAQYRNIPMHADEYRANEIDANRMSSLRGCFGRQSKSKGTMAATNEIRSVTPETSPLVSGEGVAGDAATLSRYISVILALDKRMGTKEEQGERYARMLIQSTQYHRIIRYIMLNRKWFGKTAMAAMDEFYAAKDANDAIPQDRFRISYGSAYAALTTMVKHFSEAMRDATAEDTLGDPGISDADALVVAEHLSKFRAFTINYVRSAAADVMSINFVVKFWTDVISFVNIDRTLHNFIWFKRCAIDPETGRVTPSPALYDAEGTIRCVIIKPNELYAEYLRLSRSRGHDPELSQAGIRGECSNERYWVPAPKGQKNQSHRFPMRELKENEKGQVTNVWVLRCDRMDEAMQQIFAGQFEQNEDEDQERLEF